ncbi:MAG TPA: hypothetical protein VKI17_09915 [Gemmataceae bacterium]|nr:hypothetical protein [Gemmataceae bacterium]
MVSYAAGACSRKPGMCHCLLALGRPDLPAAQALLGQALAAVKKPAEAIPHLRQALAGQSL